MNFLCEAGGGGGTGTPSQGPPPPLRTEPQSFSDLSAKWSQSESCLAPNSFFQDEVLGMFVPELRKELAHCSHGKLVLLLRKLALGTADSTVFRAFYKSKPQPECLKQQPMLESVFRYVCLDNAQ